MYRTISLIISIATVGSLLLLSVFQAAPVVVLGGGIIGILALASYEVRYNPNRDQLRRNLFILGSASFILIIAYVFIGLTHNFDSWHWYAVFGLADLEKPLTSAPKRDSSLITQFCKTEFSA